MSRLNPILLPVIVLLFVLPACSPGTPEQDANAFGTELAQIVSVALTQTASASTATPPATFTPEIPSFTPTQTSSPTPVFTFTPIVPQIRVSVPTNCRTGPGKVYDRVGALLVGEVAEVAARNPTSNYWYIRNPDAPGQFCWLWGEYATLTGNTSVLPVYTPPPIPTPEPAFEVRYDGKDTCVGWWMDFKLVNTGGITFKSIALTLRDTVTDTVLSKYADGFTDNDGCLDTVTKDNLDPGGARIVSAPAFNYDPAGHKIRATITLCSKIGQNGTCVTDTIIFTP